MAKNDGWNEEAQERVRDALEAVMKRAAKVMQTEIKEIRDNLDITSDEEWDQLVEQLIDEDNEELSIDRYNSFIYYGKWYSGEIRGYK